MRTLKLGVLKGALDGVTGSRSAWVAAQLRQAFQAGDTCAQIPEANIVRFTGALPGDLVARLESLATDRNESPAQTCAALIAGIGSRGDGVAVAPAGENAHFGQLRPVLVPLARASMAAIEEKKIILAEAATGSGKGRLVAALALERRRCGPVVIAAPLSVTRQIVEELEFLEPGCKPALLLGRANFVSQSALAGWLADNPVKALQDWCDSGGPPASSQTRQLNALVRGRLAWLFEDLVSIAGPDVPVSSWRLDELSTSEDAAEQTYQSLHELARRDADIIICSHTFLAAQTRLQEWCETGDFTLPARIPTLLVDEAHQLENAFAAIYAHSVHMKAFGRLIGHCGLPRATRNDALAAIEDLSGQILALCRNDAERTVTTLQEGSALQDPISRLASALEKVPKTRRRGDAATEGARNQLRYHLLALRRALSGKATLRPETTPVREYPVLTIGRANMTGPLESLWSRCEGVALVSATLYLPEANGVMSGAYSRWVLAIPKERVVYAPPIVPAWTYEGARGHLLSGRPSPDDSPGWLDALAADILTIHGQARGGLLVLLTSYRTLEAVRERIETKLDGLLVAQGALMSAHSCVARFREIGQTGRPVWLGVGSAWTGIDLADKSVHPSDDLLLTDLFIPRAPFGCNQTLTHARRKQINPYVFVLEACRMMRQGIGRLVRRENTPLRHLWVSDARLLPPSRSYPIISNLLKPYRREGDTDRVQEASRA